MAGPFAATRWQANLRCDGPCHAIYSDPDNCASILVNPFFCLGCRAAWEKALPVVEDVAPEKPASQKAVVEAEILTLQEEAAKLPE